MHIKFLIKRFEMGLDGVFGQAQLAADQLVRQPFGQQAEDLLLARGQRQYRSERIEPGT